MSQVLFPPSPISLLKDAGRGALASLAGGLRESARALKSGDSDAAENALKRLRLQELSTMSALTAAREKSGKVARRTLRGRLEAKRYARLDARIGALDLLSVSVLLLARATHRLLMEERDARPGWLAPAMDNLSRSLKALAEDPESPNARLRAREAAAEAAREGACGENLGVSDPRVALVAEGIRLAASDVAKVATPEETKPSPRRRATVAPRASYLRGRLEGRDTAAPLHTSVLRAA